MGHRMIKAVERKAEQECAAYRSLVLRPWLSRLRKKQAKEMAKREVTSEREDHSDPVGPQTQTRKHYSVVFSTDPVAWKTGSPWNQGSARLTEVCSYVGVLGQAWGLPSAGSVMRGVEMMIPTLFSSEIVDHN